MSGKLRLLAIAAPEVPSLAELGYRSANLSSYFGFYAPAGTPADIVNRLNVEVNKLLAQAEVRDRLHKLSNVPSGATSAQFEATIRNEYAANGKIIKEANIKAE